MRKLIYTDYRVGSNLSFIPFLNYASTVRMANISTLRYTFVK